jgi:hypothetical protein
MRTRMVTSLCVLLTIVGISIFPIVLAADSMPSNQWVPAVSRAIPDSQAILSESVRDPFNSAAPRLGTLGLAETPVIRTVSFLFSCRQALNPGCSLLDPDTSLFLLHCHLAI